MFHKAENLMVVVKELLRTMCSDMLCLKYIIDVISIPLLSSFLDELIQQ
jgi:hypothetical protein